MYFQKGVFKMNEKERKINLTNETWGGFVGHMERCGWKLTKTGLLRSAFIKGELVAPVIISIKQRYKYRHNNYNKGRKYDGLNDILYVVIMPI